MPGADALPPALPRRWPIVQARRMPGYAGLVLPAAVFDLDFAQATVDSALTVGTSSGWDRTETWSATATAGSRHTVGSSGTLTSIRFETTGANAGSTVQGFVYSDATGSPNALLATTNTQSGVSSGVNTLTINSGGLAVTAGQVLWVGLQESGSSSFSIRAMASTGTNAYWSDTPPLDDPATGGGIFYAHAHQWAVWAEASPAVAQLAAAGFVSAGGAPRITPATGLLVESGESIVATRAAGALDQGTVALELTTAASLAANQMAYGIDDNSANNRLNLYRSSSATALALYLGSGGASQASLVGTNGSAAHSTTYKLAARWATNNVGFAVGGVLATDTSCTVPAMTVERIGTRNSNAEPWTGYIRRIRRWDTALSDAALRSLSS